MCGSSEISALNQASGHREEHVFSFVRHRGSLGQATALAALWKDLRKLAQDAMPQTANEQHQQRSGAPNEASAICQQQHRPCGPVKFWAKWFHQPCCQPRSHRTTAKAAAFEWPDPWITDDNQRQVSWCERRGRYYTENPLFVDWRHPLVFKLVLQLSGCQHWCSTDNQIKWTRLKWCI